MSQVAANKELLRKSLSKSGTGCVIKSALGDLEFEGGHLVKINGQRPQYMDGDRLIDAVKTIGVELLLAKKQLEGCRIEEIDHD